MTELRSERLVIRPIAAADIPAFLAYRREPEVARYQSWSADYTEADARALVDAQPASGWPEAGEWVQLGLHLLDGPGALIGDVAVGADAEQPGTFELGVTLAGAQQGRGFALEARRVVLAHLMDVRGAHRVVMQGDVLNAPVLALMRSLGLRHEGTVLEGDWFKGEWTTLERFALLDREWQSR